MLIDFFMALSKAERTRQHIIEKAAPFFNKKGYADTSLADIVAATGLTKGAIYGNFENKDDLALQVFDHNFGLLKAGTQRFMDAQSGAVEKLLAMVEYYRQEYKQVAARGGCPLLNAATEADDNFPALRNKVRQGIRAWKRSIMQVIEMGQAQKTIRPGIDANKYATVFIALLEGGVMLAKAMDDPQQLNEALDRVDEMIRSELAT